MVNPCMGLLLSSCFRAIFLAACFLDRFLCSTWNPVSSSRPAVLESRRAQELSRLAVAPTFPPRAALARPYLDSSEHGGTLDAVGMTIRGEPAFGRAYQSRRNLVFGGSKDPNHDAVMRIGGEAPRRRTHSFPRRKSHGTSRDPATSNRHRRPITSGRIGPKLSGVFSAQ